MRFESFTVDAVRQAARTSSACLRAGYEIRAGQVYSGANRATQVETALWRKGNVMKKLLLAGAALGTAMTLSAAQADPLTLTSDQMDGVTAAGYAYVDGYKNVDINEHITKRVDILKQKYIVQYVDVNGYYADADGAANCFGYGCETITYAIADTNAFRNMSTSISGAESATNFYYDYYDKGHGGYGYDYGD